MATPTTNHHAHPAQILIVGAGVFGLSTALSILDSPSYNSSHLTIIDSASTLPNPVGSSVDASRIIRADYAAPSYARLACLAQDHWRDQSPSGWGGDRRYTESGFILTGDAGQEHYVRSAMENVQNLAKQGLPMQYDKIQALNNREEIRHATQLPGVSGDTGYANWNSGWADAEACVAFALKKIRTHAGKDRVEIRADTHVQELVLEEGTCKGVRTSHGIISADLTILATGAWTPSLVNLQNRCLATGQVLAYVRLSQEEQEFLEKRPVIINFVRGTFIIPPREREFKIARHGFGYRNPCEVEYACEGEIKKGKASAPKTDCQIPGEAEVALREALAELFPADASDLPEGFPRSLLDISKRAFTKTRLCWYTDTPTGDFLIDYPPITKDRSLFVATGGSGHGFKFLPVLGRYILDAIEGNLDPEYKEMWRWPEDGEVRKRFADGSDFQECLDGSRGGPQGMLLAEELYKGVARIEVN